ncbi:MAG: glycoside hydrolase family 3 C-terminal domain-containing protein [Lachnospiraceae bacterium]
MKKYTLDYKEYYKLARQVAAQSCVLLRNEKQALPLKSGEKVAMFGRSTFNYYKSGLGSGGLVNTPYVVSILDALQEEEDLVLNADVLQVYESWIEEHPYDAGQGWAKVPWSQEEMPVTDELIALAGDADVAIITIARTAGEDQDTRVEEGSYLLTEIEKDMIEKVCKSFQRTVVLLNVGNIIDMKWVEEYKPSAVMYVWQGGQEGGNAVCDILMGRENPSGSLTDTIAYDIKDYPSTVYFGDADRNFYQEDIYVGYRYFETFAQEKVLYPFGFGLSYTTFDMKAKIAGDIAYNDLEIEVEVTNTGTCAGRETVQVYMSAPQGLLGKPVRVLVAFAKTEVLEAGETASIMIPVEKECLASFDDSGVTGTASSFVLEAGKYEFYIGEDVRGAVLCGSVEQDFLIVEALEEAYAPTQGFKRLKPIKMADGSFYPAEESVPLRTLDPSEKVLARRMPEISYTGDLGYKLEDVYAGNVSLEEFIGQLSEDDLICLFRGEGMSSPRVTPGTASAFGGVTDTLVDFGIPAACCADGPSGIRMDCGTVATSLPNATAVGCTFNYDLTQALYSMLGLELRRHKIDTLLGPGMNIHRSPLNGRNFEYISEDPYLTGRMSCAQLLGIDSAGVTCTVKHFCGNNQEMRRHYVDNVISARALREIYLKGFEMAVKEGKCHSVMTTYGPVNGIWTAGSYDLNTVILRDQWGFEGIVMTDWGAMANFEGKVGSKQNRAPMVVAGNDLYMVTSDSAKNLEQDNVKEQLEAGYVKKSDLQRNAMHILQFILDYPVMQHFLYPDRVDIIEEHKPECFDMAGEEIHYVKITSGQDGYKVDTSIIDTTQGSSVIFGIIAEDADVYEVSMKMKSDLTAFAQIPITFFYDNTFKGMVTIFGTEGKSVTQKAEIGFLHGNTHFVKLFFGATGLKLEEVVFYKCHK